MLTLPRSLTLTPAQFAEVCAANPEAVLELDSHTDSVRQGARTVGQLTRFSGRRCRCCWCC